MSRGTSTKERPAAGDPLSRFVVALVDRAIRAAPILEPSRRVAEMLARYAGVGGVSSLLYAVLVALAVSCFDLHHDLSALIAFAVVTPINFALHRVFTFHSRGMLRADLTRYLLLQAMSFIVCIVMMSVCVDALGLPYAFGIVGAVVLVPAVSFVVMERWVFAEKVI